jgi:CMP-N-acetylneuraminic acid synthetase
VTTPPRPRIVALLPLKNHSERIPGKNFRPLAGKPLFRWILDTLLSLDEIAEVIINTDAKAKLAELGCVSAGRVRIRDRRADLCGDFVSMNLVLGDDVANVDADLYVMTHTTNPMLGAGTIRRAIGEFLAAKASGTADSAFTVNRFQSRFYSTDGRPLNHDPANLIRTQDLEPWLEENSNLYLFTRESFAATKSRIGRKPVMVTTPRLESVDVDDQEGWDLAEAIARGTAATVSARA